MIQITLKAKYHAYIISLMPDKGDVQKINYLLQVRNGITGSYDAEQDITVNVDEELVKNMYLIIGSQQERLAAADNREIKEALIPQLMAHPELLQAIIDTTAANAAQTEQLRQTGVDFIMSIMA
jgi:hypothetical protein